MALFTLEIVEGKQSGRTFELGGALTVGRDESTAVSLEDDQVSRRHALISPTTEGAVVEDLNSTNGTYVNDQPIHGSREINPGDRVRFGLTVMELRAGRDQAASPPAADVVPEITVLGHGVLEPVPDRDLSWTGSPTPGIPSFRVDEAEPAFIPRSVAGDPEGEADYAALASLVDRRVKQGTSTAAFAFLSIAALVVLIFFGVR